METPPVTPPRRRSRTGPVLAAGALALAAAGGVASAAPTISGADTDVWNVANPTPTYTVDSTLGGGSPVSWTLGGLVGTASATPFVLKLDQITEDGTYTLNAQDQGDGATASRVFRIDRTPPKITVTRPTSGAVLDLNASVLADYTCEGAVSCTGTVASGAAIDTSKAGAATFTVKAADDAGNQAISLVDYTVTSPGNPPPAGTTGGPSEPISLVPATSSPKRTPFRPRTLNAKALLPRAGVRIPTRTPLLRWSPRKGATLYNVQIYWLHGTSATKVVSVFPRRHNLRVPAGRVAYGHTYVWRVWPYLNGRYAERPLGLSYFTVKKGPARRTTR